MAYTVRRSSAVTWFTERGSFRTLALIVILVAGFGLMAKLGMMKGWPTWIYGKLAIWVVLGAAATAVRKLADHGKLWIVLLPVFGAVAAYLAILHPG